MVRAIHRHCGLGQSVPVTGRLSDSLIRSSFAYGRASRRMFASARYAPDLWMFSLLCCRVRCSAQRSGALSLRPWSYTAG